MTLANRACGGGIVAWKGTDLTDAPGNQYGAYIADSRIIRVCVSFPISTLRSKPNACWCVAVLIRMRVTVARCECDDGHRRGMFPR